MPFDFLEVEVSISEIRSLVDSGFEVEVTSPDGWVPVSNFIDKGLWPEYVLETSEGHSIRVNENHLFETKEGWKYAKDLVGLSGETFLSDDGTYVAGTVSATGQVIPIVDITVDHPNHRYYTEGISSHNTGVGKSLGMCHFAAADISMGRNVLYITLEMAEEKIAERIDQNLFDLTNDEIQKLSRDSFRTAVDKIKERAHGKLIIKEYPTASAHTGHFRALLQELKLKKNFTPDVIYIDYLNICASSRIKGLGNSINTYSLIKSIAEEIRGLAVEFNVPIWSATQVTRSGFGNTDIELTDTSESFGLPATADLMIAFISTEQLEEMNQIMVKQLKNRYHDVNTYKRFTVGIDRPHMRLYDVEDPTSNLMQDSQQSATPAGSTPFAASRDRNKKLSTNGFKV